MIEAAENINDEFQPKESEQIDTRTDLEELADLSEDLRVQRREITKLATRELNKRRENFKKRITITEDRSFEIAAMWKDYKYLENSYNSLFKICYPKGIKFNPDGFGKPDLNSVKAMPNSVGAIVTKIGNDNG